MCLSAYNKIKYYLNFIRKMYIINMYDIDLSKERRKDKYV